MKDLVVTMGDKTVIIKDCPPETEAVIDFFQAQNQKLKDEVATVTSDLEGVEEQLEELEEQKAEWNAYREASLPSDEVEELIQKEAVARVNAIASIKKLAPDLELDTSVGVRGMQEQMIAHLDPSVDLTGKEPAEVEGIFKGIELYSVKSPQESQSTELPTGNSNGGKAKTSSQVYLTETYSGRF